MRLSTSSTNYLVISCCDALLISDKRNANLSTTLISLPKKVTDEQTAKNDKQSRLEKDVQASKSEDQDKVEEKEVVVGCCMSNCEQHLGAITSHKRLLVWCCAGPAASWQLSCCWQLVKRPVDLVFDIQGQHVLVADKTGDVLNFSLKDAGRNRVLTADQSPPSDGADERSPAPVLLGHLSMLLSLTMSGCGRFVASSDRDEKIRVSCYPRAHNIASFCLGHSEFVSQLRALPSFPDLLLSASGDGTLRIWDLENGQELSSLDTHQHSQPWVLDASEDSQNGRNTASTAGTHHHTCTGSNDNSSGNRDDGGSGSNDGDSGNNANSSSNKDGGSNSNDDGSSNKDDGSGTNEESPGYTNGRDRVVPKQCAIVSVAVTTDPAREGTDVVAAVFDKARTVAVYGSAARQLRFWGQAALPRPASTVCWLAPDTLVTVCAPVTSVSAAESCMGEADSSPVLVWRWDGKELACLPQHPLSVFAAQHRHRFHGVYAMDPQVLYKQRYDNVADYQKKKQVRILQQAEHQKQVQEQQMMRQSKRLRLADSSAEMS